ncbi:hypothetical protein GCM10011487_24460 [Steroidobacter agaridevorans]|uniref:Uncharacterized protein n=1 Tax=Steroidobacter agaridevorans TaxID=2695856 RepID=A0A829YCT2_9GAMM|nr:hypothetical protein [Steroidobacter agaridevorans]GFE80446.1 hypothetical protein GCM10011487_24460 [Steroidobacter agaridevorans]GFE87502.1 hypothetical protein GCM10011488_24560 [Steroidobacter agaridevorans]
MITFQRPLLVGALMGLPLLASAADQPATDNADRALTSSGSAPLVEKVKRATEQFKNLNVALNQGWVAATTCVSGPNFGAMGVHFGLPARIGDGEVKGDEPELLIYEPLSGGDTRLVGVEFIVIADDWADKHPNGEPPSVDGHLMNFVGEPNRYGLPAFYELHVWAWEHNPDGYFADWNKLVTCNKQTAD